MVEEYSEEMFQELIEQVDFLIDEFIVSKYFSKLSDVEKDQADSLIANFSEAIYRGFGLFPKDWDKSSVVLCCLNILPQKVTAGDDYFKAVGPVLTAFFTFLMGKAILNNGHELISAVKEIEEEILEESRDPANWGRAKTFAMAALENGVDLDNEEEMGEFLEFYNQETMKSGLSIPEMIDAKFSEEDGELPSKSFEVYYKIPSKKVARKKLLENPNIVFNYSEDGIDVLFLFGDIGDEDTIKSGFFIEKNKVTLKAQNLDDLEEGKRIIKEGLGFTAQYLGEEEVDLKELMMEEMSEEFIENFINSPLEPLEEYIGRTPRQLSETERGREELDRYLEGMKLVISLSGEEEIFSVLDLDEVRRRLNLKKSDGKVIKDGVEELLIEKMPARFTPEDVCNGIMVWRDFKSNTKEIKGWDKSWAAGVEYLVNRMDYGGEYSRGEIGEDYGISANTISNKFREIADSLNIYIYEIE